MKKNILILLGSLLVCVIISCNYLDTKQCKCDKLKTLFTIPGIYEGKTIGYAHYVLSENLSKNCIDSAMMVDLAIKYSDTVKVGYPANIIMFFSSDKDFIPNETSQVMEEINKSCLVVINLDVITKKPNDFLFYNEQGNRIYWGKKWLPKRK
ncbi:hypothetical protein [Chitinophaga sp. LS1]|uniref:hypothetical protein n=1 Tax=Chitinophaga sp. LS1 TaxID=3051176 RepID=UPI002AABD633|nr:hypothetical protein [Chitinophaga sp. LS1]WPV63904.1 hypothetical protein QQL36_19075 [Chitinophaga sp. LS1]